MMKRSATGLGAGQVLSVLAMLMVLAGCGPGPADDADPAQVDSKISVRFMVTGLAGTGLQMALSRQLPSQAMAQVEQVAVTSDGVHAFGETLATGDAYRVQVTSQPTDPGQECTVDHGEGVAGDSDVRTVEVSCPGVHKSWTLGADSTMVSGEAGAVEVDVRYTLPNSNPVDLGAYGLRGLDIFSNLFSQPGANLAVYSDASGKSYWIAAESRQYEFNRYAWTKLDMEWWVRKTSSQSRFTLVVSKIHLIGRVDAAGSLPFLDGQLIAGVHTGIYASTFNEITRELNPARLYDRFGFVYMSVKLSDSRVPEFNFDNGSLGEPEFYPADRFEVDFDPIRTRGDGLTHIYLREPIRINVDLSAVPVGQLVRIEMQNFTWAGNHLTAEGGAVAFFRDPAQFDPGAPDQAMTVEMEGVTLVHAQPVPANFQSTAAPAPPCTSPSAARAVLTLDAPGYWLQESEVLPLRWIRLQRGGSTEGVVSARIRLAPGTATPGVDYTAEEFVIRFADGQSTASVPLELLDDADEEVAETFTLTLHDAAGCADLGAITGATVTIVDDDAPAASPASYTLGGTVTGLAGSGLTIDNIGTNQLPISVNGSFQFARTFASGHIYRIGVVSQPQSPRQSCEVRNGSGVITSSNVTNVEIVCTTLPDGAGLDPSFGIDGRAWVSDLSAIAYDTELARQADGKLLVVSGGNRVLRLLANGTPDPDFGTAGDGVVVVTSGQRVAYRVTAVAVQPDGRIVVAGNAPSGVLGRPDMLAARYTADGALDTSFAGGRGIATVDVSTWSDGVSQVLVQTDGSILLAGVAGDLAGNGNSKFAVLRLTPAGDIDPAYGLGGLASVGIDSFSVPRAATRTGDGGVVLVGRVARSGGTFADAGIVKFTAAGVPDPLFGSEGNGIVRTVIDGSHEEARDVAVQPDGKIVVLVTSGSFTWLTRYLADGQVDLTFGVKGEAAVATSMQGWALALQADGSVWVAGAVSSADGSHTDYGVARFTAGGTTDGTFGNGGLLPVDLFGGFDIPGAILLQPDGKLVVAGQARNGSSTGLGLVRLVP
jgi:uncharacterized delta-60 repeat protein